MLALLTRAGRPMLVSHHRLLGLMALLQASASVSSDIGTGQRSTSAAPRGNPSDVPGVQINKTGRSPSEKEKDLLDLFARTELVTEAEIVVTGISLTVDTSNVTTAKEERTVRFLFPQSMSTSNLQTEKPRKCEFTARDSHRNYSYSKRAT